MRLTTIWTLPDLPLRERLNRTGEAAMRGLAHRLPRRLAYWSLVDSGGRYMGGSERPREVIPEVPFMEVLRRAGEDVERRGEGERVRVEIRPSDVRRRIPPTAPPKHYRGAP